MFGKKSAAKKSGVGIGIDIGNFSVKVAQVSKKQNTPELEGFGYSKIDHTKLSGIADSIKDACGQLKLDNKSVNAAISSEGVIIRYLMLPAMGDDDLKKAMEFEIERYVPFDRRDAVSDYLVLNEQADMKNMKVLLVAAKKEVVNERVKLLKGAGLNPEVITIDSIVLKNVFDINYPNKKNKTIGLLNIGSKVSNINIIRDSVSCFMRDVQLGGDNITQLLKEKLELSAEDAEKTKCDLSLEDKEKFKIIEPVLGNLLNEVYLSFDYYESEFGMVVDEVFISGGTSSLGWLAHFLKENLNREITVINAIEKIPVNPSVTKNKLQSKTASFVVPIGLALETFI